MIPEFLAAAATAIGIRALARGPVPAQRTAVLTCMDARIVPAELFATTSGDINVLRNAGARATPDMLRSLALATASFGLRHIAVVHHTDCALTGQNNVELRARVRNATGRDDADSIDFLPHDDLVEGLRHECAVIAASPLIAAGLSVHGFVYDVESGSLRLDTKCTTETSGAAADAPD